MKLSPKVYKPIWITFRTRGGSTLMVRPSQVSGIATISRKLHRRRLARTYWVRGVLKRKRYTYSTLYVTATDYIEVRGTAAEVRRKIEQGIRAELERISAAAEHGARLVNNATRNRRRRAA